MVWDWRTIILSVMGLICFGLLIYTIYGFIDLCILERKIRKDKWI